MSRENIEEQALKIVDKLLEARLIPTSDAVILIRAITDKNDNTISQPQVYPFPTNIPGFPTMPNTPTCPQFPIVYCQNESTGHNPQQWNTTTTIC